MNLYLNYKFILDRRCQFSSQILVICGMFWFSGFIWRKLRLRFIECSELFKVSLLLVKERVGSGFNASRAVILMSKTGMAVEKKFFQKSRIGSITCWKLVPNARRIGRIIGSDSASHFDTPQSHGNDLEERKLGSVRVKAEKCWSAFLCLWTTASKTWSEGVFTSHCDRREKMAPLR